MQHIPHYYIAAAKQIGILAEIHDDVLDKA